MTSKRLPHPVIRPMRRKDAAAVTKMMKKLQEFHRDECRVGASHFVKFCLGPRRLSDAWVAFYDDEPAGFAVTDDWMNFVRAMPTRSMRLLYVEEKFRNQGIGAALIAFILQNGLKKGIERLDTKASTYNRKANIFYQKLGFYKTGLHSQSYGIEKAALLKLSKRRTPHEKNLQT